MYMRIGKPGECAGNPRYQWHLLCGRAVGTNIPVGSEEGVKLV